MDEEGDEEQPSQSNIAGQDDDAYYDEEPSYEEPEEIPPVPPLPNGVH